MKMYFNKSSRWRITCSVLLILTAFIIHSCKKENTKTAQQEPVKTDLDLIADAQSYFTKEVNIPQNGPVVNGTGSSKTFRQLLGKAAAFDHAYIQQEPIGKIVVIPINFSKEMYVDRTEGYLRLSDISNLIIYTDSLKKKHAEIVTRIPDDTYLADTSRNKLFSGIVTVEDWHGNYLKGMQYSQGKIVKMLGAPESQNTQKAVNGVKKANDMVCTTTDYYMVYTDASAVKKTVNATHYIYQYSETVCAIVWDNTGAGGIDYSGVGGGSNTGCPVPTGPLTPDPWQNGLKHVINAMGGGAPNQPCTTTGSGNNNNFTIEIVDSVKDYPCLKGLILDKLLQQQNYINFIVQFQTSQKPTLTWTDAPLAWDQPIQGTTAYTYQLGQEGSNSGTGLSRKITLNTQMLANSSQLLIVSAVIHETLHAYIGYNISLATDNVKNNYNDYGTWFAALDAFYTARDLPSNYSGHYQMLTDYFNQATNILAQWDNNQHSQKEYVMAMLYGLNTVDPSCPPDMKARLDQVYNDMLTTYQITADDLTDFNKQNLNTDRLHKLPVSGC